MRFKYIKILNYWLLKLQQKALHKPKLFLFFFGVVFFIFIMGTTRLQFLMSIDDLIDPDFQTYEHLQLVNHEFNDKNSTILSIESEKPFNKDFICQIQKWIYYTAKNTPEILKIQSTFGIRQAKIQNLKFSMDSHLNFDCKSNLPETEKVIEAFKLIENSPWKGLLTSLHNYSLTFNIIVNDPQDKKYGSIDTKIVQRLQDHFHESFKQISNISVYWGGTLTYQSELRKAFDQTQALNGLMFILSLFIFRIFLSSWKAGFLFNGTILYTLGVTYGLMGYLQIPVDVLTNTTGLMMIIGCLEDFVFIIYGMLKFNWSFRKSTRRFLLPSLFTTLTTAIGFGSLITSDLGIIRRFGLISSISTFCEWAACFILLPALVAQFPRIGQITFSSKRFIPKDPFQNKVSPQLSYGMIIFVFVSFLFSYRLTIKDSPNDFFFDNHPINITTKHFLKTRNWVNELSLLFNGEIDTQRKNEIIIAAKKIPFISAIEYSEDVKNYLNDQVEEVHKNLINQIWIHSSHSKRLISSHGYERAQVYINSMENEDIDTLKKGITQVCQKDCELVGSLISYNEFSTRVLDTLFSSLGISLMLVIGILIFLAFNLNFRELIAIICSSLWGPLALLSLFIIFKLPLFFVSCICASILVGMAGDNAIQFIFYKTKKQQHSSILDGPINQLNEATIIISIGMILLTSVFLLSQLAPLTKLGIFILIGFVLCYLGDLWILRGLLPKGEIHDRNK